MFPLFICREMDMKSVFPGLQQLMTGERYTGSAPWKMPDTVICFHGESLGTREVHKDNAEEHVKDGT